MTLSNTVIDDIESRKGDPDVVACKVTLEGKRTLREAQRQEQTEVGQMEIEANGLIQRYFEYATQKLETSMSYNLSNSTDLKSFATNFIRLRNICLFRSKTVTATQYQEQYSTLASNLNQACEEMKSRSAFVDWRSFLVITAAASASASQSAAHTAVESNSTNNSPSTKKRARNSEDIKRVQKSLKESTKSLETQLMDHIKLENRRVQEHNARKPVRGGHDTGVATDPTTSNGCTEE